MELKTRGVCCRLLHMVSLRCSTKQNPHNLRPHIVGSGSLCLVTKPLPNHQFLLHSMFLSSLLPAYGRHYFKCHSELNFYTTKPIKINDLRLFISYLSGIPKSESSLSRGTHLPSQPSPLGETAEAGEFRVGSHPGLHCEAISQANKTLECSEPRPPLCSSVTEFACVSGLCAVMSLSRAAWSLHRL